MHTETLNELQHDHDFAVINTHGEKRTIQVLILTATTMVIEIAAGVAFGSMALLADGWHMGTHVAAFMITIFAYRYARRHADSPAFAFGTGKVSVLGGFTSAVTLAVVALIMLAESLQRIFNPHDILFNEAIAVASLGLAVNLISALLLKDHHHHHHPVDNEKDHHHEEHDTHHHQHHDHNLRAAYMHVLADALTSVLAITALVSGKYFGWVWMDPVMGIVGAIVITRWAYGLVRDTSPVLLDGSIDESYKSAIRSKIEGESDNRIADLHIWRVGPHHYAAILSIVTHHPQAPEHYKNLLAEFHRLSHITVEINRCTTEACVLLAGQTRRQE